MRFRSSVAPLVAASLLLLATGCRVHTSGGKHGNVEIATPFGDMHVTSDAADIGQRTGITLYPGAVPKLRQRTDGDHDNGSADVNFNFGKFQMHVLAASYTTGDPVDKVAAFYRADLGKHFGDVITCQGGRPVGQPTRTADGLTCSSKQGSGHTYEFGSDNELELRTGSPERQHLVSIKSEDGHTALGLVSLQLPKDVTAGDDTASE